MNYYNPYIENDVQEEELLNYFRIDNHCISRGLHQFFFFDLVVVFHAGIGKIFHFHF